jgi:predicted  nucleic acid-binding Zn-ribbon protein
MADPMKYNEADLRRMREQVRTLEARLANERDKVKRESLQNEINGLKNSISGKYN